MIVVQPPPEPQPEPVPPPIEPRSESVTVSVTKTEKARIVELAAAAGLSQSAWCGRPIRDQLARER